MELENFAFLPMQFLDTFQKECEVFVRKRSSFFARKRVDFRHQIVWKTGRKISDIFTLIYQIVKYMDSVTLVTLKMKWYLNCGENSILNFEKKA
jgi:hypothetical protein